MFPVLVKQQDLHCPCYTVHTVGERDFLRYSCLENLPKTNVFENVQERPLCLQKRPRTSALSSKTSKNVRSVFKNVQEHPSNSFFACAMADDNIPPPEPDGRDQPPPPEPDGRDRPPTRHLPPPEPDGRDQPRPLLPSPTEGNNNPPPEPDRRDKLVLPPFRRFQFFKSLSHIAWFGLGLLWTSVLLSFLLLVIGSAVGGEGGAGRPNFGE